MKNKILNLIIINGVIACMLSGCSSTLSKVNNLQKNTGNKSNAEYDKGQPEETIRDGVYLGKEKRFTLKLDKDKWGVIRPIDDDTKLIYKDDEDISIYIDCKEAETLMTYEEYAQSFEENYIKEIPEAKFDESEPFEIDGLTTYKMGISLKEDGKEVYCISYRIFSDKYKYFFYSSAIPYEKKDECEKRIDGIIKTFKRNDIGKKLEKDLEEK